MYILGIVVLGGLAVALFASKKCGNEPPPTTPQIATATATQEAPISLNAPPPPPKLDELPDAGDDAGKSATKTTSGGQVGAACSNCQGTAPPALQSAVSSAAAAARGCYQRALRNSEVSGKMTVGITIASTGAVCGVNISNDTTGSGEVKSCVVGKFNGRSFPPPSGGCVTVQVPLSFSIVQPK